MRYFDTSILVSAIVREERHHERCAMLLKETDPGNGAILAHGLAECFSQLTGGRLPVKVSASLAAKVIEQNLFKRLKVVALTAKETLETLKSAESDGIRGGGIYDALHLKAARKLGATEIFTLNLRHFRAFAPDLAERIREP